jgi:hypothetical protein
LKKNERRELCVRAKSAKNAGKILPPFFAGSLKSFKLPLGWLKPKINGIEEYNFEFRLLFCSGGFEYTT